MIPLCWIVVLTLMANFSSLPSVRGLASFLPKRWLGMSENGLIPARRCSTDSEPQTLRMHLGLDDPRKISLEQSLAAWPGQVEIAQAVGVTRGRVSQILGKARMRWAKRITSLTSLREEMAELLSSNGGIMTLRELGEAVLVRRGSAQMEPERTCTAQAVTRAALEVERGMQATRWVERRSGRLIGGARTNDSSGARAG